MAYKPKKGQRPNVSFPEPESGCLHFSLAGSIDRPAYWKQFILLPKKASIEDIEPEIKTFVRRKFQSQTTMLGA